MVAHVPIVPPWLEGTGRSVRADARRNTASCSEPPSRSYSHGVSVPLGVCRPHAPYSHYNDIGLSSKLPCFPSAGRL